MKNPNPRGLGSMWRNNSWFYLNVLFSCIYLTWRLLYTIPLGYGWISAIAGCLLFAVELFGFLEALIHYYNLRDVKNYPLPEIDDADFPDVDVFIATYNETEDVLYKTVNGCRHMEYPDKSRVHIYLCDDGRRAEVRALAQKMGVSYLDRPDNSGAKAGNLNNALAKSSSPYVVTLDADMIPHHNFLLETVPYFIRQEQQNVHREPEEQRHIGFVQTPQAFYNPDLFQFNLFSEGRIPNEQDYFYRDIQVSRNKTNSVIYGGSNTVIARRALEDIGGFYTGSITEDYATGILMQRKGYICIARDKVLASGLSPTDLQSLISQRIRWARGVIATNRKLHVFLGRGLSFGQKMNYWASMWYWFSPVKRLVYFFAPILFAVFGYMVLDCTLGEILLFWLPMYITSNITLNKLSKNLRTVRWTNLYESILFPFLLFPILLETVGVTTKTFKVTSKGRVQSNVGSNLLFLVPFGLLWLLSAIGILNCLRIILDSGSLGPSVVLFWLVVNLFTLSMAMFFVVGRQLLRQSERAVISTECELETENTIYHGMTLNLSEKGVAICMDSPVFIDPQRPAYLHIYSGRYAARLQVQSVHVDSRKNDWKYAFAIIDYCDSYDEYLQILFDRVPTLPQQLSKGSGSFDDLRINVARRVTKPTYEQRGLPRIVAQTQLTDTEGRSWMLCDFNYRFCAVQAQGEQVQGMALVVDAAAQVVLECEWLRALSDDKWLYAIHNSMELDADEIKRTALEAWATQVWKHAAETAEAAETPIAQEPQATATDAAFDEMEHL